MPSSSSKRRREARGAHNGGEKKENEVLVERPLTRSRSAQLGVEPGSLVLHDECMLEKIAQLINARGSGGTPSVVVVVGAGISTNAGIADFRSERKLLLDMVPSVNKLWNVKPYNKSFR